MNAPLIAPQPLDAFTCALDGINLIEASAGTGKTWTIAALFLRLLLEARPDGSAPPRVEEILVVTYTKAATAELRERLRARLAEAAAAFEHGESDDTLLKTLLQQHADPEARALARARLDAALTGFDAASVYTIHGFCQRVLTDAAFESGQSFAAELVSDDAARLQEMAADFWRTRLIDDAQLVSLLVKAGDTPQAWLADIRPYLGKPYLCPDPAPAADLAEAETERNAAWAAVLSLDGEALEQGLALIRTSKALNSRSYTAKVRERVCAVCSSLIAASELPQLDKKLRDDLARLTPSQLAERTLDGQATPSHPLFDAIERWLDAEEALTEALAAKRAELKLELLAWLNREQAARRQQSRERGFDDLLTDLAAALEHPEHGAQLAAHLARTWQVALIDEFQDTDPVQYSIFRLGFLATGRSVFLVGDPKQAIYSFRGADIFAYLDAKGAATRHYSLATNFRSRPELVAAVNQLFEREAPFVLEGIDYRPVHARPDAGPGLLADDGCAPLQWLMLPAGERGKPLSKERAQALAAGACADEIARLLNDARAGSAMLESGHALSGGDLAVLVATHRQGEAMRAALAERGVKCVALSQDSVFASIEAQELAALLRAWSEPGHEGLLREALATELMGLTAAELASLTDDENAWEALRQDFAADHACWRERGFMPAWWRFYARTRVAERLLPLPDGERRLTNLAHLAELIQKQSETMPGLAPLAAWFDATVAAPPAAEEALMRLESDAELVKIVTIHTSKGLQYPLVFCPFLWDGQLERRETLFWRYRDSGTTRLTPSAHYPGSAAARDKALTETLSEKMRLLYVALTRAQYRQYVVWGAVSGLETAALSWLLHAAGARTLADLEMNKLDDAGAIQATITSWVERSDGAAGLATIAPEAEPQRLVPPPRVAYIPQPRRIERAIYTPWRVTSFTALAHRADTPQVARLAETPDHEQGMAVEQAEIETEPVFDRFSFPRGARAGVCLHSMFEHVDFGAAREVLSAAVAKELAQSGFSEHWHDAALDIVERTLAVPLDAGVTLAGVPSKRRLVEMEFMLPVQKLDVARLKAILGDPAYGLAEPLRQAAAALDFPAIEGFLKGFIDLVFEAGGCFYVVDYKSNHLGNSDSDYAPEKLAEPIAREHYYLQYLFYSVALRRYLKTRGLAAAPISVRYLFLRGLNEQGSGVWQDTPRPALLDALDAWLGSTD